MGPSWAGPENIRSSNILSTSATSMVTRNLKTLGIPLARDFRPRFLDPMRLAEVPNVVQGGQEHPLFELLGRALQGVGAGPASAVGRRSNALGHRG